MILVDSSAWVEFYRSSGDPGVSRAVADAVAADQVAVCGIIQVEIVSFASDEKAYQQLREDFEAFHWLELKREDFERAIDLGVRLRQEGFTIPATDLIIAASAIQSGELLYHADAHFDLIEAHSDLEANNLREKESS